MILFSYFSMEINNKIYLGLSVLINSRNLHQTNRVNPCKKYEKKCYRAFDSPVLPASYHL